VSMQTYRAGMTSY